MCDSKFSRSMRSTRCVFILQIVTLGLWGAFLCYQWASNLNFLVGKKRYNELILAVLFGVVAIIDIICAVSGKALPIMWEWVSVFVYNGILFYLVLALRNNISDSIKKTLHTKFQIITVLIIAEFILQAIENKDGLYSLLSICDIGIILAQLPLIQSMFNIALRDSIGTAEADASYRDKQQFGKKMLRVLGIILFIIFLLIFLNALFSGVPIERIHFKYLIIGCAALSVLDE